MLVERSSYESHPLGRMEWVKLYGVLVRVPGHLVEALHLDVHGGQGVFLPAQPVQGVYAPGLPLPADGTEGSP